MVPLEQVEPLPGEQGAFQATGAGPQFASRDLPLLIPKGWCHFEARLTAEAPARAAVYADRGRGYEPEPLLAAEIDPLDGVVGELRIPAGTVRLRFDPLDRTGAFRLGSVTVVQATLWVQIGRALRPLRRRVGRLGKQLSQGARTIGRAIVVRPARALARSVVGVILALRPTSRARTLQVEAERKLAKIPGGDNRWHALGTEPRFRLTGDRPPHGWCTVTTLVRSADTSPAHARLISAGRREVELPRLPVPDSGLVEGRVYVPLRTKELFWDPIGRAGAFEHGETVELRPVTVFPWAARRERVVRPR